MRSLVTFGDKKLEDKMDDHVGVRNGVRTHSVRIRLREGMANVACFIDDMADEERRCGWANGRSGRRRNRGGWNDERR